VIIFTLVTSRKLLNRTLLRSSLVQNLSVTGATGNIGDGRFSWPPIHAFSALFLTSRVFAEPWTITEWQCTLALTELCSVAVGDERWLISTQNYQCVISFGGNEYVVMHIRPPTEYDW